MSESLQPHGLQHVRLPCPPPSPGDHSNSCPLSQWCHPSISASVVPFSSCLQSFPASGSFPMSQFFTSCGQSIGVSASTSIFPMNTQDWSPLGWTGVGSPCCPRDSQESSPTLQFKTINSSVLSFLYSPTFTSIQLLEKLYPWWESFIGRIMSLLFNMLSRLVIPFPPSNKRLFNFMATVTICSDFGAPKNKVSHSFLIYLPWSARTNAMILVFWMLSYKPTFSLSSFTFIKKLFSSSSLSALKVVSSAYLRLLIFLPAILIPSCFFQPSVSHDVLCIKVK